MKIRTLVPKVMFLGLGLLGVLVLGAFTRTGGPAPADELPPRPTTVPTPSPAGDGAPVRGASLTLRVANAPAGAWTVVQWQDGHSGWHPVTGWQGRLDDGAGHEKTWWVAPRDFGTGPFRWLVYDRPEGEVIASSTSFTLPAHTGATVLVEVAVPENDGHSLPAGVAGVTAVPSHSR